MEPKKEKSLAEKLEIFDRLRDFLQRKVEENKRKKELSKSKPPDQNAVNYLFRITSELSRVSEDVKKNSPLI